MSCKTDSLTRYQRNVFNQSLFLEGLRLTKVGRVLFCGEGEFDGRIRPYFCVYLAALLFDLYGRVMRYG